MTLTMASMSHAILSVSHAANKSSGIIASYAFVCYLILTFFFLFLMKPVKNNTIDGILLRLASACALAAGIVGAHGLTGNWIQNALSVGNSTSVEYFGGSILGLLGACAGAYLIFLWLPSKHYDRDLNQASILLGFFIPTLFSAFPGPIGHGIAQILTAFAKLAMSLFGSSIS